MRPHQSLRVCASADRTRIAIASRPAEAATPLALRP